MKTLCDRQQLVDAFGVAAGITPQKTPKPIVKQARVEAGNGRLTIFATDFEMSARIHVASVKVTEPGVALLPVRETYALLREIADPTVTLEARAGRCTLLTSGGSFELLGDDPEQFPAPIDLEQGVVVQLPSQRLAAMIRQTAFAAAKEDSRYAINGVLVEYRDGSLRLVATDGRRLALCYHHLAPEALAESDRGRQLEMIVPLRALLALVRAIPDGATDRIKVVFSPNQAGFVLEGETGASSMLVSQLLDRQFPDYEGVIPKVADTTVEVSRDLLEASLRRVAVLSSGEVRLVRFHFGSSTLELSAESSGVGRGEAALDVDVKGAGGEISFNPDFVLEALRATDQEVIRIDMTDEETPAKFSLGEAFTYVLMPISAG